MAVKRLADRIEKVLQLVVSVGIDHLVKKMSVPLLHAHSLLLHGFTGQSHGEKIVLGPFPPALARLFLLSDVRRVLKIEIDRFVNGEIEVGGSTRPRDFIVLANALAIYL